MGILSPWSSRSGKCLCDVEELSTMQHTWGESLEEAADEAGRLGNLGEVLELQHVMDGAICSLPEKERVVVRWFYGLDGRPHTQGEVPSPPHILRMTLIDPAIC